MARIAINLLPAEFTVEKLKKAKFHKIQAVGVIIILTMIFLTVLTMTLRFLQSNNIAEVQARLNTSEEKVTNLKETQASLVLLKDRLAIINQYLGVPSQQATMYQFIDKLVPASAVVNAITIGKNGEAELLVLVSDFVILDNLVNNLTLEQKNEGRISQVSIDSLNRGRDGVYRVGLKIKPI